MLSLLLATLLTQATMSPTSDLSTNRVRVPGIPSYRSLRDWLSDTVSVKGFGCVGDGVTDDTDCLEAAIAKYSNGTSAVASGALYVPAGTYKFTRPLIYAGSAAYGFRMFGATSSTAGSAGSSRLLYAGPDGLPALTLVGMGITLDNIEVVGSGTSKYGIYITASNPVNAQLGTSVSPGTATVTPSSMTAIATGAYLPIDSGSNLEYVFVTGTTGSTFTATFRKSHTSSAQVGHSAGTANVVLRRVTVTGVGGAGSVGVCACSVNNAATPQVNDIRLEHCSLYGDYSTSGTAFATAGGGNVKNFSISGGFILYWDVGIDLSGSGSSGNEIDKVTLSNSRTVDIKLGAGGGATLVRSVESEGSPMFISDTAATSSPQQLTVLNSNWQGTSTAGTYDWVIATHLNLTLIGNQFYNYRTASSVAKISNGGLAMAGDTVSTTSIGNWYRKAPAGYAPIEDASRNALLPYYYNSQPVSVTSIGDRGGDGGALVALQTYVPISALTSETATYVARSGMVRAGSTDSAIAFRNNANSGDIIGLSKDSSDIVRIGDTTGWRANGPAADAGVMALTTTTITNVALQSQALATTPWTGSATATNNSGTAPDGTTTATKLENAGSVSQSIYEPMTLTSGATYTLSMWAKGTETSTQIEFGVNCPDFGGSGWPPSATVSMSGPGSISTSGGVAYVTGLSTSQWSRAVLTMTALTTCTISIYPDFATSHTAGNANLVWGVQLETGSVANRYVATTTVPASWTSGMATATVPAWCRPVCSNTSSLNPVQCSVTGTGLSAIGTTGDSINYGCF